MKIFKGSGSQASAYYFAEQYDWVTFAYENDFKSRDYYVFENYKIFFEYYCRLKPRERFFYELVKENKPCHFYIDFDFDNKDYPNITFAEINSIYSKMKIKIIESLCLETFIKKEDIHVIEMDSSSKKKFSKHLIFKMKGKCFNDSWSCEGFIKKYNLKDQFIYIDKSVYYRNSQMRMIYSVKRKNKNNSKRYLRMNGESKEKFIINEKNFFNSLISFELKNSLEYCEFILCEWDGVRTQNSNNNNKKRKFQKRDKIQKTGEFKINPLVPIGIPKVPSISFDICNYLCMKYNTIPKNIYSIQYFPSTNMLKIFIRNTSAHEIICPLKGGVHKNNNSQFIFFLSSSTFVHRCLDFDDCGLKPSKKTEFLPLKLKEKCEKFNSFEINPWHTYMN